MSLNKEISGLIKSEHAIGAIYLGLTAAFIADLLPHPMDAVYFNIQKKNRDKFIKGEITPKQYWRRDIIAYYGCDAVWWGFLLLIATSVGKSAKDKLIILGTLVGAGAVIGVIHHNIKKDIEELSLKNPIKPFIGKK